MEEIRKLLGHFRHKFRSEKCDLFCGTLKRTLFPEATLRKIGLRIFPNNPVVYRYLESSS